MRKRSSSRTVPAGIVSLYKTSPRVTLTKTAGDVYTLICTFTRKDYDLLVLVIYTDGTSEWISTFGTEDNSRYRMHSRYREVIHTGDQATTTWYGEQAFELVHVRLTSRIRAIIPVVYSAINNHTGSFRRHGVSTYVLPGRFDRLPHNPTGVVVRAKHASLNPFRYSFVPCVIYNTAQGGEIDTSQQHYSRMFTERRPTWDGATERVLKNRGPVNSRKRPGRSYH